MDKMNFAYGVIIIVGVLAAGILGLIATSPDDIIQPRIIPIEQISVNSYIMPKTATVGDVLLIEVEFRDDDKNIVDHVNYDISVTQDGNTILSEPGSHRHPGKHPIHETTILDESPLEIQITLQGLGHGDDISEPKGIVTTMTVVPEPEVEPEVEPEPETLPMVTTISIPAGVGVPGYEETIECYLPYEVTVTAGATVTWSNDDSAVHTVTSGHPVSGIDELFDSGIFMSGDTFEFTFNDVGTFDYFCMVHPWMVGIVNVS
ncbi:MAG: hypothetical protein HRO68_07240 [Nitrosopumilus sp.]|nr:hypothetical protein [Nitrosopumilus sp.]